MQSIQQRWIRPSPIIMIFTERFLKIQNGFFTANPKLWLLLLILAAAFAVSSCTGVRAAKGWAGPMVHGDSVYAFTNKGRFIRLTANGEPQRRLDANGNPQVDKDGKPLFVQFPPQSSKQLNASYSTAVTGPNNSLIMTVRLANQRDTAIIALDAESLRDLWVLEKYRSGNGTEFKYGRINDDVLVEGDTAYVSSLDHMVYAIDAGNGTAKWNQPYDAGDEIWATPAFYNGRLYFGDASGELVSIDPKTGGDAQVITKVEGAISMTPLIVNDIAYFGTFGSQFYAVNVVTKAHVWTAPLTSDKWFWAKPVLQNGVVYVAGMDRFLYAMDAATGATKWKYLLTGPVRTAPMIIDNMLVVATVNYDDEKGRIHVFDVSNADGGARFLWDDAARSSVIAPLTAKDKTVYFTNDKGEYFALDVSQRKKLWEYTAR